MVWPILLMLGHRRTVLLRLRLLMLLLLSHAWYASAVGWVV